MVVPAPARYLEPQAARVRCCAANRSPAPGHDGDVDLAGACIEAHLAKAVVGERPDVTAVEPRGSHDLFGGFNDLGDRESHWHSEDVPGTIKPFDVGRETKEAGPICSLVGSHALEDAGPIVQRMGTHVHHCLVPVYEPAIHPDAGRGRDRHEEGPQVLNADTRPIIQHIFNMSIDFRHFVKLMK